MWGLTLSLAELLRPIDRIDVDAKRILAQAVSIAGSLDDNGKNCGPSFGRCELAVVVAAFGPRNSKTLRRGANDARDLNCNLRATELGKGIIRSGVIVERRGAAIRREVVGTEPVLPQDDGVGRQAAYIFDEAGEMKRDLRIGRLVE